VKGNSSWGMEITSLGLWIPTGSEAIYVIYVNVVSTYLY